RSRSRPAASAAPLPRRSPPPEPRCSASPLFHTRRATVAAVPSRRMPMSVGGFARFGTPVRCKLGRAVNPSESRPTNGLGAGVGCRARFSAWLTGRSAVSVHILCSFSVHILCSYWYYYSYWSRYSSVSPHASPACRTEYVRTGNGGSLRITPYLLPILEKCAKWAERN